LPAGNNWDFHVSCEQKPASENKYGKFFWKKRKYSCIIVSNTLFFLIFVKQNENCCIVKGKKGRESMNIGEKFYCSRCMREMEDEGICRHCGYDPNQTAGRSVLEEGTLLQSGRYQLGAVIGMGGFGITYAAWDYALSQPVAVKEYFLQNICQRDIHEGDEVMTGPEQESLFQVGKLRFSREARVLGTLQSIKNVVAVLDCFEDNNTAYIVMEYVRGITLERYVQEHKVEPGRLIVMMRELIDSLIQVHAQGIIHRDISPSNIMVQENETLKLIDFGAAASEERRASGKDQTVIYNRSFAPLEQYDENGAQGPWTDVYALSATLYYLVSGVLPMESAARKGKDSLKPLSEQKLHLKKWQKKAIMDGLILQPDKRIQSMEIFRSVMYHLPMPEEVKRRRRFMIKAGISMAAVSLFSILTTVNFTYGFYLGDGVRYSLQKDGFHVVGYDGETKVLNLPENRLGISVVRINEGAFQGNRELTSVAIPANVRNIEDFSFNNCENLTEVRLDEGVESLAAHAFGNCESLQMVLVPCSLTFIDKDAFGGSTERLVLVGELDSPAAQIAAEEGLNFAHIETEDNETGITLLKYETLQEHARIPDFIDGKPVTKIVSNIEKQPVFLGDIHSVILPCYLETIGDYAFFQVQISEIEFPDTLTRIGKHAFSQSFIEEIHLPDSVTEVGESAFAVCAKLAAVSLSPQMTKIPDGCFESDSALWDVEIPKGITEVGILAFSQCDKIEKLELPLGIRIIENYAFMDCTSLKTIYLPNTLSHMNLSVFNGCPNSVILIGLDDTYAADFAKRYDFEFCSMSNYDMNMSVSSAGNLIVKEEAGESEVALLPTYFKEITIKRILDAQNLKSKRVILPTRTESVATSSFYGNKYLESIDFPDTVKTVGDLAFWGCERLTDINLPEGLEDLGGACFAYCNQLERVSLPDSLKILEEGAFENCKNISQIEIPDSLVILDSDVFAGTGLTSVVVPGNIVKCRTAFYGCEQLRDVVIEDGVRILWGTFAECNTLESVIIPESVYQISRSTFMNCRSLKDVWIYSNDVELDYEWQAVHHVDYQGIDNGKVLTHKIYLEKDPDIHLFSDSPDVIIHGYRGSSAQMYAMQHGLRFEEMEDNRYHSTDEIILPEYTSPTSVFSYEKIIENVTPVEGDVCDHYWSQFQYALGYGLDDLISACLDAYEAAGDEYDGRIVHSTRLFLEQAPALGYQTGAPIVFFENYSEHPTLKEGDVIVAVDGIKLRSNDDIIPLKAANPSGEWVYTILRPNSKDILEKMDVTVKEGAPLVATRSISPKTFETP